ncbi:hypothetical protein WAI453_009878 [Rhynchosporium graminicola]|uniref:LITAF domain-containing protein n=1 Tax=Rhynchosporium graminicola TaxID=2792576 RepID=A0A1E1KE91_9HELO|nr:uncharacterized protein RCO7_04947 [Rhynchosporium commune]
MSYPQSVADPNAQHYGVQQPMTTNQPTTDPNAHQYAVQQPMTMHSPDIENAPPSYPIAGGPNGEKNEFYGVDQPQPQPQEQTFKAGAAPANNTKYQMATPLASLQQGPAPVDCPVCGVRELTRTEFVSGGTTHLSALLCCCCLCLGCIPYMASWFKDCEHKCGSCGAFLACWHRSGRTEVIAHAKVPAPTAPAGSAPPAV